ncbi:hypothetical protein, partial [Pseudomonas sp. SIMBA_067]|uniref:hypothetical protein n=1 Tax=Pseudomonas sp. SIMBA_067 TaxID=3085807 RepID=UPI0039795CDB
ARLLATIRTINCLNDLVRIRLDMVKSSPKDIWLPCEVQPEPEERTGDQNRLRTRTCEFNVTLGVFLPGDNMGMLGEPILIDKATI